MAESESVEEANIQDRFEDKKGSTLEPFQCKFLDNSPGAILRQRFHRKEALAMGILGLPFVALSEYTLAKLPTVATTQTEDLRVEEQLLESDVAGMTALEKSNPFQRFFLGLVGCLNLRKMELSFYHPSSKKSDFSITRDFRLGGCCGFPHSTVLVFDGIEKSYAVGKVDEDFVCGKNYGIRCFQATCCCSYYYDVKELLAESQENNLFKLEVNTCCFGPYSNCCGSTLCNRNAKFNIYPYREKAFEDFLPQREAPVAVIQKIYPENGSWHSCIRSCCRTSTYALQFPKDAAVLEKALLLTALINTEYIHFQRCEAD